VQIHMKLNRIIETLVLTSLGCFLIPLTLLCNVPPTARDALIHHLALPKLWLLHNKFFHVPWAEFSYYPMNIELLYTIPLYFHNDIIPNYIHLLFGICTGLLIYWHLNRKIGHLWALLGGLIFVSTPIILRLSTMAYVDLGMTFFITGSLLSFVRWRDSEFEDGKWFYCSALCMGLALGSKYNSLIAFFFLNMMVVFICARNTGRQGMALKYGALFCIVSLLFVSPWYMMNYVSTGNPFYPLFDGIFQEYHHNASDFRGQVLKSLKENASSGLFQTRIVYYGESFWETILVPLRIFFQGKDDSPQYFDGVLNLILIVFLPFSFMDRQYRKETVLFSVFTGFLIFVAFFTEVIRIRYILSIVPFLSILCVHGMRNILNFKWDGPLFAKYGLKSVVFSVLTLCLLMNSIYLKNYFMSVDPMPYVLNHETRDAYLLRHVDSYQSIKYINDHLPQNACVRLIYMGRRGYYLDRAYVHDRYFGMTAINEMIETSSGDKSLRSYFKSQKYSHLLVRIDLFERYLKENCSEVQICDFARSFNSSTKLLYASHGYAVYEIIG